MEVDLNACYWAAMIGKVNLIHGTKVVLRPYSAGFTETELRQMYRWSRDESVLRWSGGSALSMSFEDFRDAFYQEQHRDDNHRCTFGIVTTDGTLIGRMGYFNIDRRRGEAELGIVIGEKEYWGRGFGTDAVRALLDHIFTETSLDRVYLYTYVENRRAQRCFEKCGFRSVSRTCKFSLDRGSHEELEMEIRREEWADQDPWHRPK